MSKTIKVKRTNVGKSLKPTSRKSRLNKIYLIIATLLFVVLLISTIVIAAKNSKDHIETVKTIMTTADPYFFITETPTPTTDSPNRPDVEKSELTGWIITSQYGSTVNVRTQPDVGSIETGKIEDRKVVNIIGITDVKDDGHKWYELSYNDITGFVRGDFISLEEPSDHVPDIIYGMDIEDMITGEKMYSKLDYVKRVAPNVTCNITLATKDNFIGKKMYSSDIAMIQRGTGEKLRDAASIFGKAGYELVLWDAYRPYSVTIKLSEQVKNNLLTANPKLGSKHNRGAAVDVTLYKNGVPVNMPTMTRVMDLKQSARNSSMTKEQKAFMDYLTGVMLDVGFETYSGEWWHFNDSDWETYPVMDYSLNDF